LQSGARRLLSPSCQAVAVMILDDTPRLELDPYRDERLAVSAVKSA
jgi:hypothetical protein